jgi:hypothetical protein
MRIRQIALVAREIEPVVADLRAVLGIEVSFRDPGVEVFGLCNAVMPIGSTFLEVVSPAREDTAAGRFLERRGGDGGYMVIVQSDDLRSDRSRVERLGVRVAWEIKLPDIAAIHLHPADVGGAILSLDQPEPAWSWRWAGPDWEKRMRTGVSRSIVAVELQSREPAVLSARWSEILDQPRSWDGGDCYMLALEEGEIRFGPDRDGRGEGICCVDIAVADPEAALEAARSGGFRVTEQGVMVGGVYLHLVQA